MNKLKFLIIPALLLCACNDKSDSQPDIKTLDLKSTDLAVLEHNNDLALDLFTEIAANDPVDKNIFISPLSIYYALAMTANGAAQNTYDEFADVLGWDQLARKDILESLKKLYDHLLTGSDDIELTIANSIWPRSGFSPEQAFIDDNKNYLYADVKPLDFGAPDAVDIVNKWIEDNTGGKITKALDVISPDAMMFLINAIYFNAVWKYDFDESDNTENAFRLQDGSYADKTFMNQEASLGLYSEEKFKAIKLPYSDTVYYMTVLLPEGNYTPADIMNDMDSRKWNEITHNFTVNNVKLSLPKFKFEYGTRNINQELNTLGLQEAFTLNADFSKISDTDLMISRILHKAFIDVSEKGTEAAAVTIVEIVLTSAGGDGSYAFPFIVNKPFVFAICEEQTDAVLFMGKVMNPTYE